jgi:hypothetical protein
MKQLSALVILFSAFIILFTPLCPKISFIQPDLKLIPTVSPSTDWQTYNNGEYSFNYPKNLVMINNGLILSQDNKIFFTKVTDNSKTIAEYLIKQDKISATAWEGKPSLEVKTTKKTVINGLNCIQRQEYLLAADITVISTYFKNGNYIYKAQFQPIPGNSTESDIFMYDQILSTFKFTQ